MKVKKGAFIVMICFAVLFALIAAVLLLLPLFNKSPVQISQPFSLTKATDDPSMYVWHGALKNESDSAVTLYGMTVDVHTDDAYQDQYGPLVLWDGWFDTQGGSVTLQPGEEYSLEGLRDSYGVRKPDKVIGIEITLRSAGDQAQRSYSLLGGSNVPTVVAIVLFAFAVLFALCGVLNLYGNNKRVARYQEMCAYAQTLDGTFLNGYIGERGSVGKAVGKSILSVLGGMLSAIFLGVGFYKIHSADGYAKKEFLLTKDGLYIGMPNAKPDVNAMQLVPAHEFAACTVLTEKKQVLMTDSRISLLFRSPENGLDANGIAAALNAFIASAQPFPETADGQTPAEENGKSE